MDHYPTPDELQRAQEAFAMGRDSCHDREVLYLAGGPGFQYLSSCGCDGIFGPIFGPVAPWPF